MAALLHSMRAEVRLPAMDCSAEVTLELHDALLPLEDASLRGQSNGLDDSRFIKLALQDGRRHDTTARLLSADSFAVTTAAGNEPILPPAVCFDPETPQERIDAFYTGQDTPELEFYRAQARWSVTAMSGFNLHQGDPTVLTWSIMPDGTVIPGGSQGAGEPAAPSNLVAFLNDIYGNEANWLPLFQQVFDRYSQITGVRYVYQPSDDGASFPSSHGVVGVRGDVRIGGHYIDGESGVLAYNFFPNTGDMVIDTGDFLFFSDTNSNSLRLRNVLAHEHGHGLGFRHVCPVNFTKLMEPFITLNFDGPQLDDQLGVNRFYGDRLEHNDTVGTASDTGAPLSTGSYAIGDLSIDDNSDLDFYRFNTDGSNKRATIVLRPIGATYPEGPQNNDGSCSAGTSFNSTAINNLGVELLDTNGATVLAVADLYGAGSTETIGPISLPSGTGPYFIRVFGGNIDNAQLYRLDITIADPPNVPVLEAKASALVAESCGAGNSAIDPDETVTVNYTLRNSGGAPTTNLVATLQTTGGVVAAGDPQNYGSIAAGGTATRAFTFTASGSCGGTGVATLQLQDGATNLGTVSFDFHLGAFVAGTTTLTNSATITVAPSGPATPYPSVINIAGPDATVTKVTVTLNSFGHDFPADVDLILVGPGGQKVVLMSDAGTSVSVGGLNITFDDAAASHLPQSSWLYSGTFKPTDYQPGDSLPAPAPAATYSTTLSAFNGVNPNGAWTLYVADDSPGYGGSIAAGWTLNLSTRRTVCCVTPDLKVLSVARFPDGRVVLQGSGVPNETHRVQMSDDLVFDGSDPTQTVVADGNGVLQYEDNTANAASRRFYRFLYP